MNLHLFVFMFIVTFKSIVNNVEYFAPIEKFGIDVKLEHTFVYCPNCFLQGSAPHNEDFPGRGHGMWKVLGDEFLVRSLSCHL